MSENYGIDKVIVGRDRPKGYDFEAKGKASKRSQIHPLVSWGEIGGTLAGECIFSSGRIRTRRRMPGGNLPLAGEL